MRVNEKEKQNYNKMYKERGFTNLSEYIKHLLFIDQRQYNKNIEYELEYYKDLKIEREIKAEKEIKNK